MIKHKKLAFIICIILSLLAFFSFFSFSSSSSNQSSVKKGGIKLTVSLNKKNYEFGDKVTVLSTVKNVGLVPKKFTGSSGCDKGPKITIDPSVLRFYKNEDLANPCTAVIIEYWLLPGQSIKEQIVLTPDLYISDKKIYSDESLHVTSHIRDLETSISIPLNLEKVHSERQIPNTSEEAIEYVLTNEIISKWLTDKGYPIDHSKAFSHSPSLVYYPLSSNGDKLEIYIDSDSGKITKAIVNRNDSEEEEQIIKGSPLSSSFIREIEAKPDETYKMAVSFHDESIDGGKLIQSYNGDGISHHSSSIIENYTFSMKGKDILTFSELEEIEFLRRGSLFDLR